MSDITYLPLANGTWAYLYAFQNGCIKYVVGWHVGLVASSFDKKVFSAYLTQWVAIDVPVIK